MKVLVVITALALGACQAPGATHGSLAVARPAAAPQLQGPVPADAPGSVRSVDEPLRGVDGVGASRVWLLEMHQKAVAERDAAVQLAGAAAAERDTLSARATQLEQDKAALESRCAALDAEARDLREKALELARRLAASEVARLEAEKAALERELTQGSGGRP